MSTKNTNRKNIPAALLVALPPSKTFSWNLVLSSTSGLVEIFTSTSHFPEVSNVKLASYIVGEEGEFTARD